MTTKLTDIHSASAEGGILYFRDASFRGLLYGGLLFTCVAVYIALPKGDAINWPGAVLPGFLGVGLLLLGIWRCIRKDGHGWLLAASPHELRINLGHAEGYAVAAESRQALVLPRDGVVALRRIRETMRLPHRFGVTRHHFGYIDICLRDALSPESVEAVFTHNARYAAAGKAGPYPVLVMSPHLIRLCWSAIVPNEERALALLSDYFPIQPVRDISFPDWDVLDGRQRESYLLVLWEMGMCDEAVFLARIHFAVSLKQAKALLEAQTAGAGERR